MLAGRLPDARGRFGTYGGRFVPETLMPAVLRLESEAKRAFADPVFRAALDAELAGWVGRPTPLTRAARLGEAWGAEVWLKREDLTHTGAHKINNAIGQALLARHLGAKRIIAETGAGQHGVATAAACARLGSRAWSTWAKSMWNGRRRTWNGCGGSARRWSRCGAAIGRSGPRSTRP